MIIQRQCWLPELHAQRVADFTASRFCIALIFYRRTPSCPSWYYCLLQTHEKRTFSVTKRFWDDSSRENQSVGHLESQVMRTFQPKIKLVEYAFFHDIQNFRKVWSIRNVVQRIKECIITRFSEIKRFKSSHKLCSVDVCMQLRTNLLSVGVGEDTGLAGTCIMFACKNYIRPCKAWTPTRESGHIPTKILKALT